MGLQDRRKRAFGISHTFKVMVLHLSNNEWGHKCKHCLAVLGGSIMCLTETRNKSFTATNTMLRKGVIPRETSQTL